MPIPARRGSRTPAIAHQPPEPCQLRSLMTDDGPPTSIDQFIPGLYRLSATVFGCRRPTPDTWNLERPACFEIVPTAARSGASRQICTARDHAIFRWHTHARVQGNCAPSWIFIQGRARSDLLFTMSDNTHPAKRTRQGAKRFASGRAARCPMTCVKLTCIKPTCQRPATRNKRKKAAAHAAKD